MVSRHFCTEMGNAKGNSFEMWAGFIVTRSFAAGRAPRATCRARVDVVSIEISCSPSSPASSPEYQWNSTGVDCAKPFAISTQKISMRLTVPEPSSSSSAPEHPSARRRPFESDIATRCALCARRRGAIEVGAVHVRAEDGDVTLRRDLVDELCQQEGSKSLTSTSPVAKPKTRFAT